MKDLFLKPLNLEHKNKFIEFSNQYIGQNYFNENNFHQQIILSSKSKLNCSFVLKNENSEIVGIRLTYAPGTWFKSIKSKYLKDQNFDINKIAYFKSLFVNPKYQGQGIGPYLSVESIKILKMMGATHIASHSWKESPNNSSIKYLEKSGFKALGEISNYWSNYDYICSGCKLPTCECTAVEMLYQI